MSPRKKIVTPSERDQELRRMLVASAELNARPAPRRRVTLAATAVGLLVAGGLVGGAVTAAATAGDDSPDVSEGMRVMDMITRAHTELLGELFYFEGSSDGTLDVGAPPAGATGLAIANGCLGPASAELRIDGDFNSSWDCDQSNRGGGGVDFQAVPGRHVLDILVDTGSVFVWAMWVKEPPHPEPSGAQAAALADGEVTDAEYTAGRDRYIGCMGALGYPLIDPEHPSIAVQLAIPDAAVQDGTDEFCYESEWMQLDMAWQLAQEPGETVTP